MSHSLRVAFHVSGRAKSHAHMYFDMCADKLVEYWRLAKDLKGRNFKSPGYEELATRTERAAVEPVVFGGMALEATLFDLGACLLGEDFAERIDKLDPLGKFYVLSRYVNRRSPDPSGVTVQSIQALLTARNRLVHYKSQQWARGDLQQPLDAARKFHKIHLKGLDASLRALVLLSLHFDGNIFEELRILPSFKKAEYWESLVPKELHSDVKWCILQSNEEISRVTGGNGA